MGTDSDVQPGRGEVSPRRAPEQERAAFRGPEARYRAFRRSMKANPVLDTSWKVGVLTVGGVVVAAGVAMLALPGPGWATIFVGLMILASEFAWARRSLDVVKAKARDARERAMAPEARRRTQAAMVVAAVLLLAGVVLYWQAFGFPGPVGDWIVGAAPSDTLVAALAGD